VLIVRAPTFVAPRSRIASLVNATRDAPPASVILVPARFSACSSARPISSASPLSVTAQSSRSSTVSLPWRTIVAIALSSICVRAAYSRPSSGRSNVKSADVIGRSSSTSAFRSGNAVSSRSHFVAGWPRSDNPGTRSCRTARTSRPNDSASSGRVGSTNQCAGSVFGGESGSSPIWATPSVVHVITRIGTGHTDGGLPGGCTTASARTIGTGGAGIGGGFGCEHAARRARARSRIPR
jgi:hypothetical protein